jgi:phosphoglycolate phosphatase
MTAPPSCQRRTSRPLKHIFLDLDGTLTDPKTGITRCINHALEAMGRSAETELDWCIGPPLQESFRRLLGEEGGAVDQAIGIYRERFARTGLFENTLYPGVPQMLQRLRGQGARLHLATSKPHIYARRILEHFGLDTALDTVFGSELDGRNADKTELLAHALASVGADPAMSAMLGDRRHDAVGAITNGIAAWGAAWGYGTVGELQRAGVEQVFATVAEVYAEV